MPMRDNFLPAKKVAMALHALITSQFPRDYFGLVAFGRVAREVKPELLPEMSWDFEWGTNMQHALLLARKQLNRQSGTKQIIMVTDGEPTAHIEHGEAYFQYPPSPITIEETLKEVMRCTRDGIRINTFMLDESYYLRRLRRAHDARQRRPRVLHQRRHPRRLRAGRLPRPPPHPPPRQLTRRADSPADSSAVVRGQVAASSRRYCSWTAASKQTKRTTSTLVMVARTVATAIRVASATG